MSLNKDISWLRGSVDQHGWVNHHYPDLSKLDPITLNILSSIRAEYCDPQYVAFFGIDKEDVRKALAIMEAISEHN